MNLSRRTFSFLLAMTPGLGGRSLIRVLTRNDLLSRSPEEFLALSPETYLEEYKLTKRAAEALSGDRTAYLKSIFEMERRLNGLGVSLVTSADAHYPELVDAMDPEPPAALFLYGNARLLDGRTFCVLSSRNSRPADLDQIEQLTEQGVMAGEVVVTSHNKPEYQRSAVVPLRWGSPRILCLDCGLFQALGPDLKDEAFPTARLWRYEFDAKTDLVVSPFRPESHFVGENNKVRDRLVACLSRRLDFVNVAEGGNMARLIRLALKAGRPVRVSDRMIDYRSYVRAGATTIEA